jgi:hypothetical protein
MAAALTEQLRETDPQARELSRWNLARTLLSEHGGRLLAHLAESYRLRFYFLTGVRPSRRADVPGILDELKSSEPAGDATRLGAAVRAVLDELRGASPAAIILLTDGITTEGPSLVEAAEAARRRGVPLFLVGIGSDRPAGELRLSDLLVDDVVFLNDLVTFRFKLTGNGLPGKRVAVALREEGKPDVLARVDVTVGPDGQPQAVRLPYRPKAVGRFRYVIEIELVEGLSTRPPPLVRTVRVRTEKIRVLLVGGGPSFEYRFLRNLLARDDTIELRTALEDADVEYAAQDKAALPVLPVRREDLFAYDVVILGDAGPATLGASFLRNLAEFVDSPRGGAVVLSAGPKAMPQAFRDTPLARLLPFDPGKVHSPDPTKPLTEGFVAEPTEAGLAWPGVQLGDTPEESRAIWRNLPPLYWMVELGELKPGARVLAENPARVGPDGRRWPLVVMQYVGAGKVLFHGTDETWRWRRSGDGSFARYWLQTIRGLSRAKLSEGDRSAQLSTDRREYGVGDPVRVRVRFTDDRLAPAEDSGVIVIAQRQGHKTEQIQLHRSDAGRGTLEGVFGPLGAGSYHAWLAAPTLAGPAPSTDFTVALPEGEMARVQMETAEMRQAAEITRGRFYTFSEADRLADDLPEGRQVPIESLPPVPLWNKWPLLATFLLLVIGEWVLRRRGGMA